LTDVEPDRAQAELRGRTTRERRVLIALLVLIVIAAGAVAYITLNPPCASLTAVGGFGPGKTIEIVCAKEQDLKPFAVIALAGLVIAAGLVVFLFRRKARATD
jgi:hypothetical protein